MIWFMSKPSELSAEFILDLKHELEADMRLLEELPGRIELKKKRYDAALLFAPVGFNPDAIPVKRVSAKIEEIPATQEFLPANHVDVNVENPSWTRAIQTVLDNSDRGISHKELLSQVRSKYPMMPASNGEKGFYNGISKLSEREALVKHGGLLYSSNVVNLIKARGESLPDEPDIQIRSGSSGELILSLLGKNLAGLSAKDLKNLASKNPDAPKSLTEHSQYIYNILATLIGSGLVVKQDGLYRQATKASK